MCSRGTDQKAYPLCPLCYNQPPIFAAAKTDGDIEEGVPERVAPASQQARRWWGAGKVVVLLGTGGRRCSTLATVRWRGNVMRAMVPSQPHTMK